MAYETISNFEVSGILQHMGVLRSGIYQESKLKYYSINFI